MVLLKKTYGDDFVSFKTFDELKKWGVMQLSIHKFFDDRNMTDWKEIKNYDKTSSHYWEYNTTGIEPQLSGEKLEQMIKLNKHVFTTASTNYYSGKHKEAYWIFFTLPLSLARKLGEKLRENGYWYIIDNCKDICEKYADEKKMFEKYENKDFAHIRSNINHRDPNDVFTERYAHDVTNRYHPDVECSDYCDKSLFEGDNQLVEMTVTDPDVNRTTLYKVLYEILEQL
jgi:hypothetical protein